LSAGKVSNALDTAASKTVSVQSPTLTRAWARDRHGRER
jgi:hypothetical protein